MNAIGYLITPIASRYHREPVRFIYFCTLTAIFIAKTFGAVLDETSTYEYLALAGAIAFGGEVARKKVTPTA